MRRLLFILLCGCIFASCATQKNVVYLQDNVMDATYMAVAGGEIRLKPNDVISIVVSSKNPELASIFNLRGLSATTASGQQVGYNFSSTQYETLCYTVDPEGDIDYPIFGELNVEGMTRFEVAEMIKSKILESGMIKDPIVTIQFINLTFSVLGEVTSPGQYTISKDRITILEALSMAKDLTISGVRDRVFLTRNDEGEIRTYSLDMRSTDIYQSPAFYVQQGDVIYVEPNRQRANQSTVNANTLISPSFWMSFASFILTLTVLFVN